LVLEQAFESLGGRVPRSAKPAAVLPLPASGTTGSKYDDRFSHVLKAAAEVMADEGYEQATIRKIAQRARMSIAGLYYYISNKEELLFHIQFSTFDCLVRDLKARLDAQRETPPEQRLRIVVENHLQHFLKNLPALKVCARELESLRGDSYQQVLERRREYYRITRGIIDELASGAGELDSDLAALLLFGMLNWVYTWYNPRRHRDLKNLQEQLSHLFINGIKPRTKEETRA
jgi:AcrR family transcriptional regulator